jgi:hypothetical protein
VMDTVSGCNSTENLVLKEINLPLQYQQVYVIYIKTCKKSKLKLNYSQ